MVIKAPRGTKDIIPSDHISGITLKANLENFAHFMDMKR